MPLVAQHSGTGCDNVGMLPYANGTPPGLEPLRDQHRPGPSLVFGNLQKSTLRLFKKANYIGIEQKHILFLY